MISELSNRVAIVTGSGQGLGRAYVKALARRGARVVVNDLGVNLDGSTGTENAVSNVVSEIESDGGEAIESAADVTNPTQVLQMVEMAIGKWGRVDILVNNAGILRDKSFLKMTEDDFRKVLEVHLMGAFNCCKAVWPHMRNQGYGRIVNITSSSGLYGNFGQSNYGAAKMALVGLMNTLHLEGMKYDIRVSCLSPVASTRMTTPQLAEDTIELLDPQAVAAGILFLVSKDAPSRTIVASAAGAMSRVIVAETHGAYIDSISPEMIARKWPEIAALNTPLDEISEAREQTQKFLHLARTGPGN